MAKASEPPTCSICGKAHWMRDPHVWDKPSGTKADRLALADEVLATKAAKPPRKRKARPGDGKALMRALTGSSQPSIDPPKKRGRPATGFDKTAYQRELMRKRRAEKAATKTEEPK